MKCRDNTEGAAASTEPREQLLHENDNYLQLETIILNTSRNAVIPLSW